MSLPVKDGNGSLTALKTTLSASEHLPHHIVQSVASTVSVTGTIGVGNSLTIGTISDTVQLEVDNYSYPGGTYGALVTKITASSGDPVHVSASKSNPVFVVSDSDKPVYVYSEDGKPVFVTSSEGRVVFVSASANSPVSVTSSANKPIYVTNDSYYPVYVTSSESYPVTTKEKLPSLIVRANFSTFAGTINWAATGSSNISGTFILADSSSTRRGLMFANNTNKDLYIALGNTDFASTNGFLLSNTASAPIAYSFVLYPSGTYFAEPSFAGIKHSGFFVSSSNIDVQVNVFKTE